jgi:multidrug efflux system outer membrane protein
VKVALAVAAVLNLLASCVPNTPTNAPDSALPKTFRGETNVMASLAATPWEKFYDDPVLQALIAKSLAKNYSVLEAYQTVLEARANLAAVSGQQQPQGQVTAQAPGSANILNKNPASPGKVFEPSANFGVSYQIDLFGKLASQTAAARAQYLQSVYAQDTVAWTLVSQVATAYFELLAYDELAAVTKRTIVDDKENVRLTSLRVKLGEDSIQSLYQAQQALYAATEALPQIEQNVVQTENTLSLLTGEYPHDIERGLALDKQVKMPEIPPTGIPSELLRRRPDIQQADYALVAADANLDVARKELYPSLSLGASVGLSGVIVNGVNLPSYLGPLASQSVNGIWFGPTGLLSIVPQLTQVIFSGGSLQANVAANRANQQKLVASYLNTVLTADVEVSNDIAAYEYQREYNKQTQLATDTATLSLKVAKERFEYGETSELEVLNSQTYLYNSETKLVETKLSARLALVQLYLALGGGWQS